MADLFFIGKQSEFGQENAGRRTRPHGNDPGRQQDAFKSFRLTANTVLPPQRRLPVRLPFLRGFHRRSLPRQDRRRLHHRQRRRAVGSIRSVLREQRKAAQAKFWESVEEGQEFTGTVKSLTNFGAFVDLGGVDGMIHISELSWNRIKHPSEVVSVGDTVQVYVKSLDRENGKISLGYKKKEDNPWEILKNEYPVGTVCDATVVGMTTFGAFAKILPGIDGLIHISQIADRRIEKPQDVLKVGDVVKVKITDIDFDKKRVSLSIRALLEDQGEDASEE